MKQIATSLVLAVFFISAMVFAMAKGPIKEGHKDKVGLDKAKINCVYCHKTAAIAKKKGQDTKKMVKESKYCAIKDCHQ